MGYIPPPPPSDLPGYISVGGATKEKPLSKNELFWREELKNPPPPDYDPNELNNIEQPRWRQYGTES